MALTGNWFQRSDSVILDRTAQERWISELGLIEYSLLDSVGNRSRVLRVKVANPNNLIEASYTPMQRVRMVDDFGIITFLGRVVSIEPDYKNQLVVITCRDYLDDIADRTVEAAGTRAGEDGDYEAVHKSFLTDDIIDGETYMPPFSVTGLSDTTVEQKGLERSLPNRIGIEYSVYQEFTSREYARKGDFTSVTNNVPGDFEFRGVKTGMEAISEIANEDAQQDLMGFYYTHTPVQNNDINHLKDPIRFPRTYYSDITREIHDGSRYYVGLQQSVEEETVPQTGDFLYFGSNSQFDGLRFTYVQYGDKIASGTYGGTLDWQYWNGTAWTTFTPTADAKFGRDTGKLYGTTYWTATNLTGWSKRDLGITPDMPTVDDADKSWVAPNASSGVTEPDDCTSVALERVDHGDEIRGTNRYWIRVYYRGNENLIVYALISGTELYTKPNLFHDFRCDDPKFFDEVWKYTHNAAGSGVTTGRDGHGGVWVSLNMTATNPISQLMWDSADNTTNFIGGATETWYFGSETPFNGVSLHAFQELIPDYSNVKLVWQWATNYNGFGNPSAWHTISGLTITGNTVANPTVITTEQHHLDTGDTITISGSNSNASINGTHIITKISDTTFSIPINVATTAGTAGHVVCHNHITETEAMGGSGTASWKQDTGITDTSNHWYLDVRFDINEYLGTITRDLTIAEHSSAYMMSKYPHSDLTSLESPNADKQSATFGLNSITVANPTVITSAATAGGTTTNHNMVTGDTVYIRATNSNPSIDGKYTATVINATTFSIPVNVSTAVGNTGTITAETRPPNGKALYWVRCFITSGTPTRVATLRDVQTSNVGTFRYFSRGTEPWIINTATTVNGSSATTPVKYCYRYAAGASAGSKFTDYTPEIQSVTSDSTFTITGNTVANPTVVTTTGPTLTISSNTVAVATVITTSAVHGMTSGDSVVITSSNSTPSINGTHTVEVLSTTTFNIGLEVTNAGSAGTAIPVKPHGLTTGHGVVISSSNSNPTINGTREVTVLSTTTFSVPVNVTTTAGTAGSVVPGKVYAMDGTTANDAVYFGAESPFTTLRLNVSDVLISASSGYSSLVLEYYAGITGVSTGDDWTSIPHKDFTYELRTAGSADIVFDMPPTWRPVQPGIKEGNTTDQSFGKTAYYVRLRNAGTTGSPSATNATLLQGFTGPNLWNNQLEVGTLASSTSTRFSDPLTYGLTLSEFAERGPRRIPIGGYEIKDHAIDFVNKIGVRGINGSYGSAEDTDSIAIYGIVKERIVDDSTLVNSVQCEKKAQALLEQLKPGITAVGGTVRTIRECHVRVPSTPIYTHLNRPMVVRAGDRVNVNIPSASISNESWFVYSIVCSRTGDGWACDMTLFQDMTKVFEPGTADRRLLRDLVTRSRETANAVFQPQDKAVLAGLDYIPEGPGRYVGREEYGPVGTANELVDGSNNAIDSTNEFRWTRKVYLNHKAKLLSSDLNLMRIDHHGISPALNEVATGGAGLTLIGRDGNTDSDLAKDVSAATSNFHPAPNEATLYLKNSSRPNNVGTGENNGTGLYLAHRDVFNDFAQYDQWGGVGGDTGKSNAEVMVGFTGFVDQTDFNTDGEFDIALPKLRSCPLIFFTVCAEDSEGSSNNNSLHIAVDTWTTVDSEVWGQGGAVPMYTNAKCKVMRHITAPSGGRDDTLQATQYTVTNVTAANPARLYTPTPVTNNSTVWIHSTTCDPPVDGIYKITDRQGDLASGYNFQLNSTNDVFPVNVTQSGTGGQYIPIHHTHPQEFGTTEWLTNVIPTFTVGIMYVVIYNSGNNVSSLNTHFKPDHTSH